MVENSQPNRLTLDDLKKKLTSPKGIIGGTVTLFLIFGLILIVQSCTPKKGNLLYGICAGFLEQQIPFPKTLKHTSVEQYPKALRIYFTHIDAFGQYQFEMTECTFVQHPQNGVQLDRVFFNQIKDVTEKERVDGKGRLYEVKREVLELFNRSKSSKSIMSQNPNLNLPQNRGYRF